MQGRVFNDFNTNGLFDTDENAGAVDVPVSGLTIRAFTGTDTLVGTAVTDADGHYTLDLPDARVRLELSVERPWWPTRQLHGLRSDVQFVDASSPQTGVNFGVHRLSEYSIDRPDLFWAAQFAGPVVESNDNRNEIAIRGASYFSKRPRNQVEDWNCPPGVPSDCNPLPSADRIERATFGEVGTVFGLAMDQASGALYASAYQKRLAGLKDRRTGAIYRIARDGHVSLFANISAETGADPHPDSDDIDEWVDCDGATVENPGTCDMSWPEVGRVGLGSVVIDPEDQNVYTVNLRQGTLVRFPLRGGAARARARAAAVQPASTAEIPNPDCGGGDWRPFSAAFDRVNEQMYVGGVCDAETSQSVTDLRAVVYRVDNPRSDTPDFVPVLDIPLNYQRGRTPTPLTYCASPNFCRWNPWPTVASTGGRSPTSTNVAGTAFTEHNNPAFPQLTAITFAEDGSMVLGFRDLIGDMGGAFVPGEIGGASDQAGYGPMVHGDMLRAGAVSNGTFSLEQNGTVAGITSAGQLTNPINWFYGAGMGPGGGYFYNPAPLATPLPVNQTETYFNIPHPYQGGLTQIPGFLDVVATSIHIKTSQANGLLWRDNTTGDTKGGLQNFRTLNPNDHGFSGFAKSNGLGDIDAFTGLAPVQIGNRLWYDLNRNGIQDADEPPVTDTVVELLDCAGRVVDSTRTDEEGEYVFAIDADTCYSVRVPLDQPSLVGWVPTQAFADNHLHPRIDSNGRVVNGRSVAFVRGHGTGQNDHTYDFGFHRPPPPPPDEPAPPVEEPRPTPEPPEAGVAGEESRPLVLTKRVVSTAGGNPRFALVVRNGGPDSMASVRVCDSLPASLAFVRATTSGRRVTGSQVCWSFASLSSGEERVLNLTTRVRTAVPAGGLVNCARATARDAPAQRVCATVRGARQPAFTG